MNEELLEKAIREISKNHDKIIDDWCKAYMAQLYQEKGSIKPGDFVLCEQVPTYHPLQPNILIKKYWFEPMSNFMEKK